MPTVANADRGIFYRDLDGARKCLGENMVECVSLESGPMSVMTMAAMHNRLATAKGRTLGKREN
ncbi:hypothetical protein N7467_005814 [Penicillium canescens]|nr:hypothetical protein N7467_005814 [Penicillium canescens]